MGDANGTCTDCSDVFTSEDLIYRSSPQIVDLEQIEDQAYSLAFPTDVKGVEVFMIALTSAREPVIKFNAFQNLGNFITLYRDGVYYISYASSIDAGENFLKDQPFLTLEGDFSDAKLSGSRVHNEAVINDRLSAIHLNVERSAVSEIYPNPSKGQIAVDLAYFKKEEGAIFTIYDINGARVEQYELKEKFTPIELQLPSGIYIYRIDSPLNSRSGTIVIL